MDCKNIRLLMHQVLDQPEKMNEERKSILSHCQECLTCSSLWLELQRIEEGLYEMDMVEMPLDFSTIDWELLAQTETQVFEELSMGNVVFPKLPNWVLALLVGVVMITFGIWGVLVLPGLWMGISQGLAIDIGGLFNFSPLVNQLLELIKDIAYWVVLLSTFWNQSLSFVLTNFIQVTVIIVACFALLIHLLKSRERLLI